LDGNDDDHFTGGEKKERKTILGNRGLEGRQGKENVGEGRKLGEEETKDDSPGSVDSQWLKNRVWSVEG